MSLEEKVLAVLRAKDGEAVSLRDVEAALEAGGKRPDTFNVRDAVWRLVDKQLADFTPCRDVFARRESRVAESTPGVVCSGDEYGVRCPHCGRVQHYVARGIKWPTREGSRGWVRPCRDCGKQVQYSAALSLRVTAEQWQD